MAWGIYEVFCVINKQLKLGQTNKKRGGIEDKT